MNKNTIIAIGAVVIVILIGAVFVLGNRGSAPQAPAAPVGQNDQQPQPAQPTPSAAPAPAAPTAGAYTSSADGFSINFPGTPRVTKTQYRSLTAGSIPLTEYRVESGSGTGVKYYEVNVYHYPESYQFPSSYLSAAMQLYAMSVSSQYPGAKLVSKIPTQFLGSPAESGVITVPVLGSTGSVYVIITVKGHATYGIGTYGIDKAGYDAFVNSFTFTQ